MDLKEAYLSVAQECIFALKCLPFGLSSVPPEASSAGDGSFVETETLLSGELGQKDLKWWTQNPNSWNG